MKNVIITVGITNESHLEWLKAFFQKTHDNPPTILKWIVLGRISDLNLCFFDFFVRGHQTNLSHVVAIVLGPGFNDALVSQLSRKLAEWGNPRILVVPSHEAPFMEVIASNANAHNTYELLVKALDAQN